MGHFLKIKKPLDLEQIIIHKSVEKNSPLHQFMETLLCDPWISFYTNKNKINHMS